MSIPFLISIAVIKNTNCVHSSANFVSKEDLRQHNINFPHIDPIHFFKNLLMQIKRVLFVANVYVVTIFYPQNNYSLA